MMTLLNDEVTVGFGAKKARLQSRTSEQAFADILSLSSSSIRLRLVVAAMAGASVMKGVARCHFLHKWNGDVSSIEIETLWRVRVRVFAGRLQTSQTEGPEWGGK